MKFRLNICKLTGCVACGFALVQFIGIFHAKAQTNSAAQLKSSVAPPPLPVPKPPIQYFRELLALPSHDRDRLLAEKTPEQRKVLLEKIHEYESMDPDRRELTLKVTELRW